MIELALAVVAFVRRILADEADGGCEFVDFGHYCVFHPIADIFDDLIGRVLDTFPGGVRELASFVGVDGEEGSDTCCADDTNDGAYCSYCFT